MPHDVNGKEISEGDIVHVPFKVLKVHATPDFCNLDLESVYGRRPDEAKELISSINSGVVEKQEPKAIAEPAALKPEATITLTQMTEAVAVLCRMIPAPFLNQNQTGVYINAANQLVVPLSSGNATLGTNLVNSQDGTNMYFTLNPGDPSSGQGG